MHLIKTAPLEEPFTVRPKGRPQKPYRAQLTVEIEGTALLIVKPAGTL